MSIKNKLNDPNLSEDETDQIIGSFVRRHENDRLRKQYARKLKDGYGISRGTPRVVPVKKTAKLRPLWLLAIAASIVLTIMVWSPWQTSLTSTELLALHLDPAKVVLPITRSGNLEPGSEEQTRQTFYNRYRAGAYQDALMAVRGLETPSSTDSFFMALGYLGIEQSDIALEIFVQLKNSDNPYHEEILWYTSLLNWKLGDLDAGIEQLRSYRIGDAYYSRAREFLKSIEK